MSFNLAFFAYLFMGIETLFLAFMTACTVTLP